MTSPPYYGLRDYGTSVWIGGNEKCDHKKASAETINTSLRKSTLKGGKEGQRVGYENKLMNKHTCNRCGAIRIDDQIGPGPESNGKNQMGSVPWEGSMANKKSVWTVSTKPFKGAHFAIFPQDLIIDCIKAGCPQDGIVLDPFMGNGFGCKKIT